MMPGQFLYGGIQISSKLNSYNKKDGARMDTIFFYHFLSLYLHHYEASAHIFWYNGGIGNNAALGL